MSSKKEIIQSLIKKKVAPVKSSAEAYAPANIALVKYWGKRNAELNLPITSSLSLSLPVGTRTKISLDASIDSVSLNGRTLESKDPFVMRLLQFCDLFRPPNTFFHIQTTNEIPTAAGLASSSSGFAALVLALNELLGCNLDKRALSIAARLGSGSASRSLFTGFVKWHAGSLDDGMDSFSEPLATSWPELSLGVWMISEQQKPIDSRQAMQRTVETSPLYKAWPETVHRDLTLVEEAIAEHDFTTLGQTAERNALAMHATMLASFPPILYWLAETVSAMQQIWKARATGLQVYFTMDAGPNLKLLFLKKDLAKVQQIFPLHAKWLIPYSPTSYETI